MGIAVDIVILAIAAVIVVSSYRVGFVKAIMGTVKSVVSLIAAYAFAPTLGQWINEKFMLDRLSSGIAETVRSLSESADGAYDLSGMVDVMDPTLKSIVTNYRVDPTKLKEVCSGVVNGNESHVDKVARFMARPVSEAISDIIAFIAIFAAAMITLSILTAVIDTIFHLPVLNTVNKTFGLLLGFVQAILFLFVLCSATSALLFSLGSVDNQIFGLAALEKSFILNLFWKLFPTAEMFGINIV